MLPLLLFRELGTVRPQTVVQAQTERSVQGLQLSKYLDLEPFHTAGVNSLDVELIEHRYLLSGSANGQIAIHDLHARPSAVDEVQCTYPVVCNVAADNTSRHKGSVMGIQWYPVDTGIFTSCGADKLVKVWDTNLMRTVSDFSFNQNIYCHDMSPIATRHSLIAVASGSAGVKLVNLKSGSMTHTLRGQGNQKSALFVQWFPRDEFLLVTSGEDGRILSWDVRYAQGCLKMFDQHNGDTAAGPNSVSTAHSGRVVSLRFLPDGLRLLSLGTDSRLRLWDVASGRNTLVNYGKLEVAGRLLVRMMTSPIESGRPLAFVPSASDIVVLDVEDGTRVDVLRGHYGRVNCVVMDRAALHVYSGANDHSIIVWTPAVTHSVVTPQRKNDVEERHRGSGLGRFARRVGGGTADAWSSDEDG